MLCSLCVRSDDYRDLLALWCNAAVSFSFTPSMGAKTMGASCIQFDVLLLLAGDARVEQAAP